MDSLVLKIIRIQILSEHNDTIWKKYQWSKCQITNSLSDQTSWYTNRTTLIQFQITNSFIKKHVLHFVTTTSRLLDLSLFFSFSTLFLRASSWALGTVTILSQCPPSLLQSPMILYGDCQVRMHPVVRMRRKVLAIVSCASCELSKTVEEKRFYQNSESLDVTGTVESKFLWKSRESHSEVCMYEMSTQQWPSTEIILFERTRQSAWLDAQAETTPIACEFLCITTTPRVNSCVLKQLRLWGSSATKKSPKTPGNAFTDALPMSSFQNFAADVAIKKTALLVFFWKLMTRINSGPKVLRCCLLR